jgi:hypothetical protein
MVNVLSLILPSRAAHQTSLVSVIWKNLRSVYILYDEYNSYVHSIGTTNKTYK